MIGNRCGIDKDCHGIYAIDALSSSAVDGLNLDFELDVLGNIVAITPTGAGGPEQARQYSYDPVYRLAEVRDANQALIEAFTYDATGNRQSKQVGAGSPQPYAYPSDSHRLSAVDGVTRTHDAVGNLTAILSGHAHPEFEVGTNNRLAAYRFNGQQLAGYVYNGQGERACKWLGSTPIRYVYDTGGRLLGEYNASGKPIAEYVYLDTLPIAVFAGSGLAYIETDHLGTPRVVVDADSNQALWHWPLTGSAFGEYTPNEDPHGTGTAYTFNFRFPGQYFDAESGLHYNYFRDYEPGTGRYIQSDPIGLADGMAIYAYVSSSPLAFLDPLGLQRICSQSSSQRWGLDLSPLSRGGLVPDGWQPWRDNGCFDVPEPCPPLDCDDPGYNGECEAQARKCRNRWGYGAAAISAGGTIVGLTPIGRVGKWCAAGVSISASATVFLTGHCDDAERKCKERCSDQCK